MESVLTVVFAFALGSIPTASLVSKYLIGADIRALGSENAGALNTYRQVGKPAGLFVLLIDAGKGALAILIGRLLGAPEVVLFVAAFAATIGHNFTPFLKFRGGKGAATVLGISAILLWQITAATVLFGAIVFIVTKHAVWSVTATFVLLNALTIVFQPVGPVVLCLVLSFVIAITHFGRQNSRLMSAIRARDWKSFMKVE